ncbi:NAD(P)H-binding protein [Rhodococcus sp. 077-4]|uniref:NAD(P)H-binding protein n=1 Tax=Rhodococcus sp. 077-4 TaxID=2789271 RepID=UPI0039F5649E
MNVFIIGITGGVGSLLAAELLNRGDTVIGLVRNHEQQNHLRDRGITTMLGDLTELSPTELADRTGDADTMVFTAGAGGGTQAATTAIDGEGVSTAIAAAELLSARPRFGLISVFPEAWRERNLGPEFDHYIDVKKHAELALTQSDLDWVILRPSALRDDPGTGTVELGPAEIHETITRADVARTMAELLHEARISRRILEVTAGATPIARAVHQNIRHDR